MDEKTINACFDAAVAVVEAGENQYCYPHQLAVKLNDERARLLAEVAPEPQESDEEAAEQPRRRPGRPRKNPLPEGE